MSTTLPASGTQGYSGDGGLATVATINQLRSVAIDANENLYITDGNSTGNAANQNVRKVTAATGIMTTLAGSGGCAYPVSGTTGCTPGAIGGVDGDGGPATSATFNSPYGILVDPNGNVYVADVYNARVRVIYEGTGSILQCKQSADRQHLHGRGRRRNQYCIRVGVRNSG